MIIIRTTNGVSVLNPIGDIDIEHEVSKWRSAQPLGHDDYINHYVYEGNPDFFDDYTFRGAWKANDNILEVDMQKARIIHLARIRAARQEKFIEMGFPYKLDSNLEIAIIPLSTRNKLNLLRNIPAVIDLLKATTPLELKAVWPQELKKED